MIFNLLRRFYRHLLVLGIIFLPLGSAQAAEPLVYYCVMKKKISIDDDGRIEEHKLTGFKFRDERIMDHGSGLIKLVEGLGFPNRLDSKILEPYMYYDKDMWRGFLEHEALLYFFKNNRNDIAMAILFT